MIAEHRKSVRLQVGNGVAVLRYSGHPALACAMRDLSETGCLIEADFHTTSLETAEVWRMLLKQGAVVCASISHPPALQHFELMSEVAHVEPERDGVIHAGLRFKPVVNQGALLQKALLSIATERLHGRNEITPVAEKHDTPGAHVDLHPPEHTHDPKHADEIGEILVKRGKLSAANVKHAKDMASATNTSISRYLVKHRAVKPVDICHTLAIQSGLPVTSLQDCEIPPPLRKIFSYLTMQRHEFVPFAETREMLCIAAAHPIDDLTRLELEKLAKRNVLVFLAPLDQIQDQQFRIRPRGPHQERHHVRVRAALHTTYQLCDEHGVNLDFELRDGTVENMSDGGFLIAGPIEKEHTPSELVRQGMCMRVEMLCGERPVHAICKIRHIETAKIGDGQNVWHIGIEIIQIVPEELNILKDACAHASIEQMKKRSRGFNPDA